ncbi:uncharacterized protein BKA78DRAFT_143412 [Phyllosticta capitalensis]|uniref:uncharacterized protein n=1 Tax=Phyllosticta capitalensis TaxID=121624 RepID=UPI0031300D2C
MQDSAEDWTEESGKMAGIYQNSIMTIAATKSDNGSGGCFSTPNDEYKAYPFAVRYCDESSYLMYCRKSQAHWSHGEYYNEAVEAPLLERAWVYQERQLSPRTLHFGNQELVWECREELACECGLWNTLPQDSLKFQRSFWPSFNDPSNFKDLQKSSISRIAGFTGEPDIVHIWHNAVMGYCGLGLTRASDRLPAIAGIAKLLQKFRRNDEYLAGLWKDSLFEDLL